MKLSNQAMALSSEVIEKIKLHPFNQELFNGTLPNDKFAFYIAQDTIYLKDYLKCQALIIAKSPHEHIKKFLKHIEYTFAIEQELVHQFYKEHLNINEAKKLTPATLSYSSYLLKTCLIEPYEIGLAAILPCFLVYKQIGQFLAQNTIDKHPFQTWIASYSDEVFYQYTDEISTIFDQTSEHTTKATQLKMLDTFYNSTCLEWHFYNDSYYQNILEPK